MTSPPRLRTVLLAFNLLILLLPLGGISLLRLYDSTLVRQTEAELLSQGVVLVEVYREKLATHLGETSAKSYGRRSRIPAPTPQDDETRFLPIVAELDLARDEIAPPAPTALPSSAPPDPAAEVVGRALQPMLTAVQTSTLAGLRLVDFRGSVVASSGQELGLALDHRPEVRTALDGGIARILRRRTPSTPQDVPRNLPSLESVSRRSGVRVVVALPVRQEGRVWGAVVLSRTPKSVLRELYEYRRHFVPGLLGLLLTVGLASWLGARFLGRPLEALSQQSERVSRGVGTVEPLAHPGTLEVQRISQAVAGMAQTLQQRADYIATLATGVSHEFKTPLTSMRGAVELLRDHLDEMTPEELERFLHMLDRDAERLERLVGRLLELARAEVLRPGEETAEVVPCLENLVRRFREEGLEVHLRADPASVQMAPEILEAIVANLLDNARQHGGDEVQVRIEAKTNGAEQLELVVADDGPGVSEANRERIFERFFTTARDRGGSGLGLPIVHALVEAHGGSLGFESSPGGTKVVVCLPISPH